MATETEVVQTLWVNSEEDHRCPYVRHNGYACECKLVHPTQAQEICDPVALEMWCLSGRADRCGFYRHKTSPVFPLLLLDPQPST